MSYSTEYKLRPTPQLNTELEKGVYLNIFVLRGVQSNQRSEASRMVVVLLLWDGCDRSYGRCRHKLRSTNCTYTSSLQ